MAVLSMGAVLTIAVIVFAVYGLFHMLFAGTKPVQPAATTNGSNVPEWVTPVVLGGLIAMGFNARMPWFIVIFGSLFCVMMLVKFGVLSFAKSPSPQAPPTPPPLPRDGRFDDATYHPTLHVPAPRRTSWGGVGVVVGIILVVGLLAFGASFVRVDQQHPPRNVSVVVAESWRQTADEIQSDVQQGIEEVKREIQAGANELAHAAKEMGRNLPIPPTQVAPIPPASVPPKVAPSPAIPPNDRNRIERVLGRNATKAVVAVKPTKEPKRRPAPQPGPPAVRIEYHKSADDLASLPTSDSPNGLYQVETDPKNQQDDYLAAYERAMAVLKNHVKDKHSGFDTATMHLPPLAWCEAHGLLRKWADTVEGKRASVLIANFSPTNVDLAYNYHLGCVRAGDAVKGYFGGLLVLGGLGLLLRIGTGVRPTPPGPKA